MENRLNLLCEAGVIDKDICSGMLANLYGLWMAANEGV